MHEPTPLCKKAPVVCSYYLRCAGVFFCMIFLFNYGWEEVLSNFKLFVNKCNCISLFWSVEWTQRSLFPQSLWKFPQTESLINFLLPNVCIDYYSKLKGCQILNASCSICTDITKQLRKMLNTVYFLSGRPALVVVLALKCDRFQTMSSETEGNQHLLRRILVQCPQQTYPRKFLKETVKLKTYFFTESLGLYKLGC